MDLFTYAIARRGSGDGGSITVDSVLSDSSENPVQNKVLKTALDAKADMSAMNAALALKANTADVTAAIAAAIGSVSSFEYYLCGNGEYDLQTGMPTVQNPDTEHIYLVPTSGSNLNMYAYIGNSFTFLGTTEVDLTGYAKTADLADVATSGSYNDLDDTPDIPTDTADLTNGAGYIKNPQATQWQLDTTGMTVYEAPPESFGNNTDTVYYASTEDVTAQDLAALQSIAQAYTGK